MVTRTSSGLDVPEHSSEVEVGFPAPHVLLLALNRPSSLNAMTPRMTNELEILIDWYLDQPSLWVAIITGNGRVFCAGADLLEWNKSKEADGTAGGMGPSFNRKNGFGSLSRRQMSKPFIAAVNGGAYGGGMEIVVNCDIVVASEEAKFAFPEVRRGVTAAQGGIPRLSRIAGHQLAAEMLLLGGNVSVKDARDRFGFVNFIAPKAGAVDVALRVARTLTEKCSPDAVQSTLRGLRLALEMGDVADAAVTAQENSPENKRCLTGENIKEGLRAFAEKRAPRWKDPAKL